MCMLSHFSHVQLFVTPWTTARQAPLPMGFPRQEYWRRLPCPPAGGLPDPEIEPGSLSLQADSLPLSHWGCPILPLAHAKSGLSALHTLSLDPLLWRSCLTAQPWRGPHLPKLFIKIGCSGHGIDIISLKMHIFILKETNKIAKPHRQN